MWHKNVDLKCLNLPNSPQSSHFPILSLEYFRKLCCSFVLHIMWIRGVSTSGMCSPSSDHSSYLPTSPFPHIQYSDFQKSLVALVSEIAFLLFSANLKNLHYPCPVKFKILNIPNSNWLLAAKPFVDI